MYILDVGFVQVTEEGYEKFLSQIKAMTAELLLKALLKPKYWVKKASNLTKKHVQFCAIDR
jgi:hypothetical protein